MKKLLSYLLVFSFLFAFSSCGDKESDFEEYTHPMKDNPVKTLPWLRSVKESLKEKESTISLYKFRGENYYFVETPFPTDVADVPYLFIYDQQGEMYSSSGGFMPREYTEVYNNFFKEAELVTLLWSNRPR